MVSVWCVVRCGVEVVCGVVCGVGRCGVWCGVVWGGVGRPKVWNIRKGLSLDFDLCVPLHFSLGVSLDFSLDVALDLPLDFSLNFSHDISLETIYTQKFEIEERKIRQIVNVEIDPRGMTNKWPTSDPRKMTHAGQAEPPSNSEKWPTIVGHFSCLKLEWKSKFSTRKVMKK